MADRAHVSSIEAIEAFRAHLVVYIAKVRPILEETSSDLRRTWMWIDRDSRMYWDGQVRRLARALEEKQQTLFSARLSNLREASAAELTEVQRARQELAEAEARLRRVRTWAREFGNRTENLSRQVEALDAYLGHDMARALAWLTEIVRNLQEYVEGPRKHAPLPSPPPSDPSTTTTRETGSGRDEPAGAGTEPPQ